MTRPLKYYSSGLWMLVLLAQLACAQAPADRPSLTNEDFDRKLSHMLRFSVPLISVEQLEQRLDEVYIFDTRQREEFEVSHIDGARYLGYKDFDPARLEGVPKDAPIVLYCSVGYRSEKIGEQLREMGYSQVFNLYGSLFEWVNRRKKVVDPSGRESTKIHTYNKNWSRWVDKEAMEKVW